jgi:hypothetical protein
MPADVYYLMPSFEQGMLYLRGQTPAQGKMNICALDNSLRYLDADGTEMSAASHDNIIKVQLDTVTFLRYNDAFLRLYPISADMGLAVKREVKILTDAKQGAYGGTSQTSSIKEIGTLYTEGSAMELNKAREYPYRVSETFFVYKGDSVLFPKKSSLRKLFPEKRAEIDAYFKAHRSFPENVAKASELLSSWAQ